MKRWLFILTVSLIVCSCANNEDDGGSVVTPDTGVTIEPTQSTAVSPTLEPVETTVSPTTFPQAFTLDEDNLEIRLPVQPEIILSDPAALQVSILAIENEALIAFSVFASLEWVTVGEQVGAISLGAFSVFPPNQPGQFALSVRNRLQELREMVGEDEISELSLLLKIEPISPDNDLAGLAVRFASPVWR